MRNIEINGYSLLDNEHVPGVNFNAETGICEIYGDSFPEHSVEFYQPLLEWLKEYIRSVKKPITFNFKLKYYNTSSSKRIFEILCILSEYEKKGGKVVVNWYFDEDDAERLIEVEDLMTASQQQINIIIDNKRDK